MAAKDFKRKFSAIFSADLAGYSRLMGDDEAATVRTLETYREVMSTLIEQHLGRVVDSPGDNLVAKFPNVVDAVQCAMALQKELQARNAGLPEDRRMEFRIGINLGDVIEEGEDFNILWPIFLPISYDCQTYTIIRTGISRLTHFASKTTPGPNSVLFQNLS